MTEFRTLFRTFYWSIRRELWEHRAIYIAPLIAAAVALFGFVLGAHRLPDQLRAVGHLDGSDAAHGLMAPYAFVAVAPMIVGVVVAVLFSLGSLYNERRDRSVLFWKSLPVSDLTTVLAKAAIPILVLPAVVFVVIVAASLLVFVVSTMVVMTSGVAPQALWAHASPEFMLTVLAIGLPYVALWAAPIYAWFILVSAWAKRTPFLWAFGAPLAACLFEKLAFGTAVVGHFLFHAVLDGVGLAFSVAGEGKAPVQHLADIDPIAMITAPHLWLGFGVAAAFLALAVRLRRVAEPI